MRGWGRVVIVYPVVVYSTVFSKDSGLMAGVVQNECRKKFLLNLLALTKKPTGRDMTRRG